MLLLSLINCSNYQNIKGSKSSDMTDEYYGDADSDTDSDTDSDSDSDSDSDTAFDSGSLDSAGDTGEAEICEEALSEAYTLFMSADDSNSQATPVLARAFINEGQQYFGRAYPWEFLNYYDFDYTPATEAPIRLVAQMSASTAFPDALELVIAVVSPAQSTAERSPLNLVFAVDTSGSMQGTGLLMAQASMRAIAHQLQPGDVVSIVSWATTASIALEGSW
jgi:Ca-activated chloride channel family protein